MLEEPAIAESDLINLLAGEYGLQAARVEFLPLGADMNTAVYRVKTVDEADYFLKLRNGDFLTASVAVPKYLSEIGIRQIIPPLATRTGELCSRLASFSAILYPFIQGRDGFERNLSDRQWVEFGAAMLQFHSADIPGDLTRGVSREDFSPRWRNSVSDFQAQIERESFVDPIAVEAAQFLRSTDAVICDLVARAERLAAALASRPAGFTLCHGDIHAWNLLIADDGALYMVDWDTLIFAPRERDLMFIGAGLAGRGRAPEEETALFYRGYGPTRLDLSALAYYRYERIIEDIAVFCEQIFLSNITGQDRVQALQYLQSNFQPDGTIELAYRSDGHY